MSNAMEDWLPRHRITVEEFHRMAEVGLLAPDARVELIEGEIIDMAPIGIEHGAACDWLTHRLIRAAEGRAIVRVAGGLELSRSTQLAPDFAVLRHRADWYAKQQPTAPETHLIIEVSCSSIRRDLDVKVGLYARYGAPEVWVLDVNRRAIHFFRSRGDLGYSDVTVTDTPGETALPLPGGGTIDLAELLSL